MELRGARLDVGAVGRPVEILHGILVELGLAIPHDERQRQLFGPATRAAIVELQSRFGLTASGVVDEETIAILLREDEASRTKQATHQVHGEVRSADGELIGGVLVRVFAISLKGEHEIGRTETTERGSYRAHYESKGSAIDLVVRAYTADEKLLAASPVLFQAAADVRVDLMAGGATYKGISEYEYVAKSVRELIHGIAIDSLSKEQIFYLASKAHVRVQNLQLYVWAQKRGKENNLPPEALYAFAREGLPTAIPALVAQSAKARRNALERALAANVIPLRARSLLDQIESAMRAAAAKLTVGAQQAGTTATILRHAAVPPALQEDVVKRWLTHEGTAEAFWTALAQDAQLEQYVPKIQLSIQLAAVTRSHAPLMKLLAARTQSFRDLATFTADEWASMVKEAGFPADVPGANDQEKASNYVATLVRTVALVLPTATFVAGLKRDTQASAGAAGFFDAHPEFDLRTDLVDNHLDPNQAELAPALRRYQRLFRLTTRYSEVAYLLSKGFHSAQSVAAIGRQPFIDAHASALGGADRAGDIFDRARQIAGAAALMFARHSTQLNSLQPSVLPKPGA